MLFFAYLCTVVAANVAISVFGIVPVGFGLSAPAGVYFAGLSLTLRDAVQERNGRQRVIVAIVLGAFLSAFLGKELAFASGAAFLVSELVDFAVYTPLRKRAWLWAVFLSNTVGSVVDSALFLWLAFGSLAFLPGQVVGKFFVTVVTVLCLFVLRQKITKARLSV